MNLSNLFLKCFLKITFFIAGSYILLLPASCILVLWLPWLSDIKLLGYILLILLFDLHLIDLGKWPFLLHWKHWLCTALQFSNSNKQLLFLKLQYLHFFSFFLLVFNIIFLWMILSTSSSGLSSNTLYRAITVNMLKLSVFFFFFFLFCTSACFCFITFFFVLKMFFFSYQEQFMYLLFSLHLEEYQWTHPYLAMKKTCWIVIYYYV